MSHKRDTLTRSVVDNLAVESVLAGDRGVTLDCATWVSYHQHGENPVEGCPAVCQRLCDVLNSAEAARGG